jgi:hypothetical protein
MKDKKAIRASRHESQPITSNTNANPQESISVTNNGLAKTIRYNGKVYKINLTED